MGPRVGEQPSIESVPWVVRHLTTSFSRRHARVSGGVRVVVAVWLVVVGSILCSIGDWPGALLFVAASLSFGATWADFWVANHLDRTINS